MISPGCSFSFEGLKQILREIRPDVKLKNVAHLLVNYRTTKDILELANAILSVAKRDYPGAIGYAQPEIAQKDLGYKVVLCDWDLALSEPRELGSNQALIYSGGDNSLEARLMKWTGNHPFVLSSLESKGLEFDDVIVAFELDRKSWDTGAGHAQALRLLRELYVAITRGRRRVVKLPKV
jgi:superfamily I DNA/RNA helicase